MTDTPSGLGWATWREAITVVRSWPNLRRTLAAAILVGSVLFCINQLDVVLHHRATAVTYVKAGVTYLVPLCVANYGLLMATRRKQGDDP